MLRTALAMPPMRSAACCRLSVRLEVALSRAWRKEVLAWSTTWSFTSRICSRAPPVLDSSPASDPADPAGGAAALLGIVIVSLLCRG